MFTGRIRMQIWNANTNMTYCISSIQDSSKKGHFRVVSSFCFKARLSAKPLIRKLFFSLVQIKLIFTRKSRKILHLASFKFCPEFLTCFPASYADVLLARHAILPRGRWLPAIRWLHAIRLKRLIRE